MLDILLYRKMECVFYDDDNFMGLRFYIGDF